LGTVKLGRNTQVKYPTAFDLPTDAEVEALLQHALDLGVRLLDTAPAYGSSELRLAPWLKRHRDDVVLCTKAGERYVDGASHYDFSREALTRSAEASLRRLGVERLDILLLHSNGDDQWILQRTDAVDTLHRLRDAGKVGAVGISAKTEAGVRGAIGALDVVMAPLSLQHPALGSALADAHAAGLGVLAIKCLASGHAAVDGQDRAERALRFVGEHAGVDCAVVGTLRHEHLTQAATVLASLGDQPASSA
jgi:aryl-alcohol dehydrogenase-like predicted oxidoreductase